MTFDPFLPPTATHSLATAPLRAPVVVPGQVARTDEVAWAGGPVLEVMLTDDGNRNGTAVLTLVFFGRQPVGIEPGCRLLAAGTIGIHQARRVILNPQLWFSPPTDGVAWPSMSPPLAAMASAPS
jgi:hypothetical protein